VSCGELAVQCVTDFFTPELRIVETRSNGRTSSQRQGEIGGHVGYDAECPSGSRASSLDDDWTGRRQINQRGSREAATPRLQVTTTQRRQKIKRFAVAVVVAHRAMSVLNRINRISSPIIADRRPTQFRPSCRRSSPTCIVDVPGPCGSTMPPRYRQ